jgi:hypothetical protein
VAGGYLDENVGEPLAAILRQLGHDADTTSEVGNKGATDVRQPLYAVRERRIVVTHDEGHFRMLHEAWVSFAREWGVGHSAKHPGILIIPTPPRLQFADAARVLVEIIGRPEPVENRLLVWRRAEGWVEEAVSFDGTTTGGE